MKEKQQQQQSIGSDGAKEIWTVLTTRDECKTSSVFFDVATIASGEPQYHVTQKQQAKAPSKNSEGTFQCR